MICKLYKKCKNMKKFPIYKNVNRNMLATQLQSMFFLFGSLIIVLLVGFYCFFPHNEFL